MTEVFVVAYTVCSDLGSAIVMFAYTVCNDSAIAMFASTVCNGSHCHVPYASAQREERQRGGDCRCVSRRGGRGIGAKPNEEDSLVFVQYCFFNLEEVWQAAAPVYSRLSSSALSSSLLLLPSQSLVGNLILLLYNDFKDCKNYIFLNMLFFI
jgi:hypothetical protein